MIPRLIYASIAMVASSSIREGYFCAGGAELSQPNTRPMGVAADSVDAGASVALVKSGVVGVVTGGSYSAGAELSTDDTGRAIAADGTRPVVGIALEASTGAGETRSALVDCPGRPTPESVEWITASGAIVAGRAVGMDNAQISSGAGVIRGIALAAAASGAKCPVKRFGSCNVTTGGSYSAGAALEVSSAGKLVVLNAGVTVAIAEEASTGADQTKKIRLV